MSQPKSQKDVPMCSNAKLQKVDLHAWNLMEAPKVTSASEAMLACRCRNKVTSVAAYSNCIQAATSAPTASLLCKFVSILTTCLDHEDTYVTRLCISGNLYLRSDLPRRLLAR